MRLAILDDGHAFATKALFALIRVASRHPVLDVLKLVKYRPDFYGARMSAVTHEAMRGPSSWSVAERELMAAIVAQGNSCEWCTQAHSAVARGAYRQDAPVRAALADLETADIPEALRATLLMLRKLAREHSVGAADMKAVLAAGASPAQIRDALAVAFAFETITRLANAFGFVLPTPAALESGAKYLLARGYR